MSKPETNSILAVKREIVSVARRILAGELPPLEGCQLIERLRWRLPNADDPFFDTFVAVASETEDLPMGHQRQHWNSESLKRKDAEGAEYEEEVRAAILEAAKEVLGRYWFVDQIPTGKE